MVLTILVGVASCSSQEPAVDEVDAVLGDYLTEPTNTRASDLIEVLGRQGRLEHTPFLVDLTRMNGSNRIRTQALTALAQIRARVDDTEPIEVGSDINGSYVELGTWVLDSTPPSEKHYQEYKALLYGKVDLEFAGLIEAVDDYQTLVGIQWGGVAFGGVRELNDPQKIPPQQANWGNNDEIVFVIRLGDNQVGYPRRVIAKHELSNDTFVDPATGVVNPFAIAYCSLCRTAVAYSRVLDGQELTFKTSGLLLNSNKLMVDDQTGTLWQLATGVAISGPLKGHSLEILPVFVMGFGQLNDLDKVMLVDLPEPFIVDPETGTLVTYAYEDADPLADYVAGGRLWFPVVGTDGLSDPLSEVWTALVDGHPVAIDVTYLGDNGVAKITVGERDLLAKSDGNSAALWDVTGLSEAEISTLTLDAGVLASSGVGIGNSSQMMMGREAWFRWASAHPNAVRWP